MKFANLLKKEIVELINKQMIISLCFIVVIFSLLGNVMNTAIQELMPSQTTITIADMDNTDFTSEILNDIKSMSNVELNLIDIDKNSDYINDENYKSVMDEYEIESFVIIPKGFTNQVKENVDNTPAMLESISLMKSASALQDTSAGNNSAISLISNIIANKLLQSNGIDDEVIAQSKNPVQVSSVTVVNDKSARIDSGTVLGWITSQGMILPLIIFVLVMYTSQMIIGAISTEKIDKTLETLLSAPLSRTSILSAKMLAAAIVALINAAVYMLSFYFMMNGVAHSGTIDTTEVFQEVLTRDAAMEQLGLALGVVDYVLIGIQLFLTIMISLAVSIILGAMATDAKSAQTLVIPIMMCAMIPFFITSFTDINTLSPVIKLLIYAIPFTHTFTATTNLMFENNTMIIIGIAYQIVLFLVCMFFAVRLFSTDKIFTSSINFGKKKKKNDITE